MHQQIEARLLAVFTIVHPEGFAIEQLAASNVLPRRIFNLYPLEARELPRRMAALLTSPAAALKFLDQMLDKEYAEVLDQLCDAVPSAQRGPLLVPVVSAGRPRLRRWCALRSRARGKSSGSPVTTRASRSCSLRQKTCRGS